jgi:hypothetical protein
MIPALSAVLHRIVLSGVTYDRVVEDLARLDGLQIMIDNMVPGKGVELNGIVNVAGIPFGQENLLDMKDSTIGALSFNFGTWQSYIEDW